MDWYLYWQMNEQAEQSRIAHQHARQVEDFTKDLSSDERAAINWAIEKHGPD